VPNIPPLNVIELFKVLIATRYTSDSQYLPLFIFPWLLQDDYVVGLCLFRKGEDMILMFLMPVSSIGSRPRVSRACQHYAKSQEDLRIVASTLSSGDLPKFIVAP